MIGRIRTVQRVVAMVAAIFETMIAFSGHIDEFHIAHVQRSDVWGVSLIARWSVNPLGMLWPEMDAAFGASGIAARPGRGLGGHHLRDRARAAEQRLARHLGLGLCEQT